MINYKFLDKILHSFILDNKFIKKSLYDLEKLIFLDRNNNFENNNHVFISSLPRAGTSILLNKIYLSGEFTSLTYQYMPFIMSPNFSKFFFRRKKNLELKRYHNDGININLNSPEAFDEAIFSMFNKDEIKYEIVNFINLVAKNKRYLSKNNNIKRINQINETLPNSLFLIPVRNPLQHAFSLLSQHKNFSKLQVKYKFIRQYMKSLEHFEFGLDHKFWNKPKTFNDQLDINYWLEQWLLFFDKIIKYYSKNKNILIFKYEDLEKQTMLDKIAEKISLINKDVLEFKIKNKEIDIYFDQKLFNECMKLYSEV